MGEFFDAALSFPAVVLSVLLVVVVLYWLLVLLGTFDLEIADGDFFDGVGLGGVPATITVSVLVVVAWFVALVGGLLLLGTSGTAGLLGGAGVLVFALVAGLFAARLVAVPLRRMFHEAPAPSRGDFVGRECVIRTGRVSSDFGQAEVTAADGSSAIVQVRQTGEHDLTAGRRALIFDYDTDGEFFWVAPA